MAWTNPPDWSVGDVPGAAQFNKIRDDLKWAVRPADIVTTAVDLVSSTTETDLLSGQASIPAGYMGTNGAVRGLLMGDYKNQSGSSRTLTLKLTFGGTTAWTDNTTVATSAVGRHDWWFEFLIGNIASASVQFVSGTFYWTTPGGATTGIGDLGTASTGGGGPWVIPLGSTDTLAVNSAVACPITFTAQHSASDANLSMRFKYASFELVGQDA